MYNISTWVNITFSWLNITTDNLLRTTICGGRFSLNCEEILYVAQGFHIELYFELDSDSDNDGIECSINFKMSHNIKMEISLV